MALHPDRTSPNPRPSAANANATAIDANVPVDVDAHVPVDVDAHVQIGVDAEGRVTHWNAAAERLTGRLAADVRGRSLASLLGPAGPGGQAQLAAIVESSDDAIVSKTLDGIVTSWNRGAQRIFGYTAEEMIGQPMTSIFPADRYDEEPQILARIARGEKVEHFETVRRRKDGSLVHVSATISPMRDETGRIVGASKIARDITERIQAERTIWLQANVDTLTQLPNRRQFQERLKQELARARRSHKRVAVLFVDLDRFKEVNDTLGHQAGDALLQEAARRIQASVREIDIVARLGGDEFTVVLPDLDAADAAAEIARRLNASLFEPFELGDVPVHISGSIGFALFPEDGESTDELLQHADLAMYASKQHGRNQARHYHQALETAARQRVTLIADLRRAIAQDELWLAYQPIVRLSDGGVDHHEVLLRWDHPERGPMPPETLVALAEEAGLMLLLGDWIFDQAVDQLARWRDEAGDRPARLALNVSSIQLRAEPAYFGRWLDRLAERGLEPDLLVFDVAEPSLAAHAEALVPVLDRLRQAGLRVAIDDFGSGRTSMVQLQRMGAETIKIDHSFLRGIEHDAQVLALCEGLVELAHKLGLRVIAEGVETATQRAVLEAIGCDLGQGHLFAAPSRNGQCVSHPDGPALSRTLHA
ncbi:putative bifunctional diguanylate cyclase/phosphodiesterase [Leptothrix discophora]|uniref:EAL domain-containing protein n=1 Tax=Leptothrix discophora TaxID=89 RepID=A0ABT9G995_LEPDI|nr:EAL domain-containing protein [Leptothrix discophora]MDP4302823.1 EAL domain-containing protein [Leptothrix discophora]